MALRDAEVCSANSEKIYSASTVVARRATGQMHQKDRCITVHNSNCTVLISASELFCVFAGTGQERGPERRESSVSSIMQNGPGVGRGG